MRYVMRSNFFVFYKQYQGIPPRSIELDNPSIESLQSFLEELPNIRTDFPINITFPEEQIPGDKLQIVKQIYGQTKQLGMKDPQIIVNHRLYSKEKQRNQTFEKSWDFKAWSKANDFIQDVVQHVKDCGLSPLEAAAYITECVSGISAYQEQKNPNTTKLPDNQFLVGAFLDVQDFVCAGYCDLMRAIVTELNMPGLSVDVLNSKAISPSGKEDKHAQILLHFNDEKYDVKGSRVIDPTWNRMIHPMNENSHSRENIKLPIMAYFLLDYRYFKHRTGIQLSNFETTETNDFGYETGIPLNETMIQINNKESFNLINQQLIEKIYFTMLQKSYPDCSFDDLYRYIELSLKESHHILNRFNQQQADVLSLITSANLLNSKQDLQWMYFVNKTNKSVLTIKEASLALNKKKQAELARAQEEAEINQLLPDVKARLAAMMQEETIASLTPEAVAEAQRMLDQHSKTLLQKMVDHLKQYFGGFVKNKDKTYTLDQSNIQEME